MRLDGTTTPRTRIPGTIDPLIDLARKMAAEIKDGRTTDYVMDYLEGEAKELRLEVEGAGGPDGVFGEAIDVLLCALDMIFVERPDATNEEILAYAAAKSEKWKRKWLAGETGADARDSFADTMKAVEDTVDPDLKLGY